MLGCKCVSPSLAEKDMYESVGNNEGGPRWTGVYAGNGGVDGGSIFARLCASEQYEDTTRREGGRFDFLYS